ncbi:hypothetical protein [Planctomicrobium piriforme]|uniref:Uncharacterized protein n=1 Tax=Planctomicrobium piriforme TaxID=1576369 RepID=A0A1I3M638_9PLAN|nr:hypothetical protein [Planctomicrobium piriforme]SFI92300.1 hypothetical protein SAMN05421753_113166 [Planctomicrobium piriforme]
MAEIRYLHVGGVVAMGFDPTAEYLLVISHSGRGVFSTCSWDRVARDPKLAYPTGGYGIGIGPIEGVRIPVVEMDYRTEKVSLSGRNGSLQLEYESGTITVIDESR